MKEEYNIVEFFSGIGSQARALRNINIKTHLQAICEWDMHAFIAYDSMHENCRILPEVEGLTKEQVLENLKKYTISNNGKEAMDYSGLCRYDENILRRILSAIRNTNNFVDINNIRGEQMPDDTDILTYSFPCQDLSNVGAFHGYNKGIDKDSGSRSSLLWQVGRILAEMEQAGKRLPRYLIMENVPTLLCPRHFNNFSEWINELSAFGYESKYVRVNARNYGIPQNRPRLLMMSVFVGNNECLRKKIREYFDSWGENEEKIVSDYKSSKFYKKKQIKDLLRIDYEAHPGLKDEAKECTPRDTASRRKIWEQNPEIVHPDGTLTQDEFIRTITTKQDRHPNSGNLYFDSGDAGLGKFRYLTPRECLLFMGFEDADYEKIKANNIKREGRYQLFSRDTIIRMAGNSIPVKMLEGFFYQLYMIEPIVEEDNGCSQQGNKKL